MSHNTAHLKMGREETAMELSKEMNDAIEKEMAGVHKDDLLQIV